MEENCGLYSKVWGNFGQSQVWKPKNTIVLPV